MFCDKFQVSDDKNREKKIKYDEKNAKNWPLEVNFCMFYTKNQTKLVSLPIIIPKTSISKVYGNRT